MSSLLGHSNTDDDRLGSGGANRLGQSGGGASRLGSSTFDSPVPTRPALVAPVQSNRTSTLPALSDQALGRASEMLDAVRDRRISWEKAKPYLDVLSADDKKTLTSVRGDLSEDEKRAMGMSTGGGGSLLGSVAHRAWNATVDHSPVGAAGHLLGQIGNTPGLSHLPGGNEVQDTLGNLSQDVNTFVKDLPAGLYKTGSAVGGDVKRGVSHPLAPSSRGTLLGGTGTSATQKELIDPTIKQYADTYGPLFHGDPAKTLGKLQDHPLGPLLDAFAVASFGWGTAGRVANFQSAYRRAFVEASATSEVSPTEYRMGKVDRTTETYQPLGYNKEFYVRPTTQQIKNEPYTNHFSVLIDPKTGDSLFSPVGASHDEIYDPLHERKQQGDSKAYDKWNQPHVIQATGIFDPRTGKVARININPDDVIGPYVSEIPKLMDNVKAQADATYITRAELKNISKTNEAGTIVIKQDTAKNRYDPSTGEKLPATWHVSAAGKRIGANFMDKDSAIAFAESHATGGLLRDVLVKEMRPFYEMTPGENLPVAPGYVRVYRGEGTGKAPTNVPDWMKANQGRWFTADRAKAERYGELKFVDVPESTLEQYRGTGGASVDEYVLPQGYVDAAEAVGGTAGPVKQLGVPVGKEVSSMISGKEGTVKGLLTSPFKPTTRVEPLVPKGPGKLGREAFMQRPMGSLLEAFENAREKSHSQELEGIAEEIVNNILLDPKMRNREDLSTRISQEFGRAKEAFGATFVRDVGKYQQKLREQPEFQNMATAGVGSALGITVRELSDIVRAGAIFIRPAYIPNNWAGNAFLNVIHQGVYAPLNLGKALVLDKHVGVMYTRGIDQAMGFNAANLMQSTPGTGYSTAFTDPVAKLMGSIADQPFRRAAWLHEARRANYKTLYDVQRLWDKAFKEKAAFEERHGIEGGDSMEWLKNSDNTPALQEIAKISLKAQEEIVKFGKYNDLERSVLRNLIFVYSWMRGAGRYFSRFPMQHPIQAAAYMNVANIGESWLNQELGGVPNFLIGAIPIGKDDKGNSRLINPFSVNPLGSGQQMIASAASAKEILTHPENFNKYRDTDPTQLFNPLIQNTIEAYTGGRSWQETLPDSIAALRLKKNLEHPGSGQIYPTSKAEAIGQFAGGSLFPRQSSQQAITRSLQRERSDQPELRIDDEVKAYEKATGASIPEGFVDLYRQDLKNLDKQKDFQHSYAKKHGSQGFDNMPPKNRAEAAVEYLGKNNLMEPDTVASFTNLIENITNDQNMNDLANRLWRVTGVGRYKEKWDELTGRAEDTTQLTPARP